MLIFDEKKYAEDIIANKKYNTVKTQGRERCILVRYLTSLGYSVSEIKNVLLKIPMSGGEFLSVSDKDVIFSKIISKANEFEFITGLEVKIYKSEMDVVLSINDEYTRNLLFVYLVYYKWACQVKHMCFYSRHNEAFMALENNNDIWKIAGLSKLRVADRYRLCNSLFTSGLYKVDNFKSHNYIYLPFVVNEGEVAITISNYDNILGELFMYINPKEYKRCCVCGCVIKKTRSPKKYCSICAYKENIRKTKENKKSLKTKTS